MRLQNYLRSFLLVLVVFTAQFIVAQTTIQGRVMDKNTKNHLPELLSLLKEPRNGTTADIDGNYTLTVAPENIHWLFHTFRTQRNAYRM